MLCWITSKNQISIYQLESRFKWTLIDQDAAEAAELPLFWTIYLAFYLFIYYLFFVFNIDFQHYIDTKNFTTQIHKNAFWLGFANITRLDLNNFDFPSKVLKFWYATLKLNTILKKKTFPLCLVLMFLLSAI